MRLRLALALCALSSGGAAGQEMTCVPTRDDTQRLSRLDVAWDEARKEVIESGDGDAMRRLGPVADPRVNLTRPQPTPGRYQCRTIKLGAASEGMLPYIAYGWFRCSVTLTPGGDLVLRKTNGSQRPVGLICPVDTRKARFVGVLELGDEVRTPRYGADTDRDMIGEVRRVGDEAWRIAFPWPAHESKLDLLELRRTR